MVAVRPLRRRGAPQRAGRARARRRGALVARPAATCVPALGAARETDTRIAYLPPPPARRRRRRHAATSMPAACPPGRASRPPGGRADRFELSLRRRPRPRAHLCRRWPGRELAVRKAPRRPRSSLGAGRKPALVVGNDRLVSLRGSDGRASATRMPGVTEVAFASDGRLAVARRRPAAARCWSAASSASRAPPRSAGSRGRRTVTGCSSRCRRRTSGCSCVRAASTGCARSRTVKGSSARARSRRSVAGAAPRRDGRPTCIMRMTQ